MSRRRTSKTILKAIDQVAGPLEKIEADSTEKVALLTVQAIAVIVRDAIPEAEAVMLYYDDDAHTQAIPHGFRSADGAWIGYDDQGHRTGPRELHLRLHEICDDIGWPYCAGLTPANEDTWTRFATEEPADLFPSGKYWSLNIDRALLAAQHLLPADTPSLPARRKSRGRARKCFLFREPRTGPGVRDVVLAAQRGPAVR